MKILVYGLNFAPEPIGVGRYTGEMAAMLAAAGHDVRVVTALPYYPEWKVGPDYSPWKYVKEQWKGVTVFRSPLWVPFRPNGRQRVLHLLSFAVLSLPLLARNLFWRPDIVWMAAPTFVCAPATLAMATLTGAKSWLHVQDYEIDIAFGMNIISGKWWQRLITGGERWLLRRFARVSSISKPMVARAIRKGVSADKTILVPNWADLKGVTPSRDCNPYRTELNIAPTATVALYSGSMGLKQCVDWLAAVAVRMQAVPGVVFVFCGDGPLKTTVDELCGRLPNVRLLPLQPTERLSELLGLADIHMLPQRQGAGELVMPSKLAGMLASARPIAAMAEDSTELADVVKSCGVVSPPGDLDAFAATIQYLHEQPRLRDELGSAGRAYACTHLSSDGVLRNLEKEMQCLIEGVNGLKEFQ